MVAAQQAVTRGVRIYPIGFGTARGSVPRDQQGRPFGGGLQPPDGGGFFGGGFRTGIDEATMKRIAEATDGKYYAASSASELQEVFNNLPTYLITRQQVMEISVAFAAAGALLAVIAIALSMIWHPLP
jgi:Ca-activated chloride channel family protein